MDPTHIMELAHQTVQYLGPLIVGGALAKIGEDSLDNTTALAQRTWTALQQRFAGNKKAMAALNFYEADPENIAGQQIIEGEIVRIVETEPAARTELQALLAEARALGLVPQQVASRIHNQTISGDAQVEVAISGDVHGGITLPVRENLPGNTTIDGPGRPKRKK